MARPKGSKNKEQVTKVVQPIVEVDKPQENIAWPFKAYERGILLAVFGHPMYAHYAYNLAVGLRYHDPNIKIAVVKEGDSLRMLDGKEKIFDEIIEAKPEWISGSKGTDYFKFKQYLNDITPFERTLYLDVDMVWSTQRSLEDFFTLVDGSDFQCWSKGRRDTEGVNNGGGDFLHFKEFASEYGIKSVYNLSSEIIYFTEKANPIFEMMRKVYNDNLLQIRKHGQGYADEPILQAALELTGTKMNESFEVTYWQNRYFTHMKHDNVIKTEYFAISAGGEQNAINTIRLYNTLTGFYFEQSGLKNPYLP